VQKAVGTLINESELKRAKAMPNYEQEYELRFSSRGLGSIFNVADIDFAVNLGEQYANPDYNPKAIKVKYPYIEKDAEIYAIGADPVDGVTQSLGYVWLGYLITGFMRWEQFYGH
jgi:hypothetical protein